MKGELDGGISSAAGGPVQVVRDRPDVMSREGAERQARTAGLCEECRMREAHYGFRTGWRAERRTTLCFPCFRSELGRRQGALARRSGVDSPGLDATQARLPLAGTLETLRTRGRHAQIAARHALDGDVPVQALDPLRATGGPVSRDFRGRHARRRPAAQSAGMDEHPASRGDATRAHMDDEARHRLAAAGRLTGGARAQV